MTDTTTPTLTDDEIDTIVHAAHSAFMAGWSYNSSVAKVKEIYADAPELHDEFERSLFLAAAARAIRGFYNLEFADRSDIVRYVWTCYGER